MSVHEVVTQAVDYACGSLLAEFPSEEHTREMLERQIVEGGGWLNHSRLLEPAEGRVHSIASHVEDNYVTLIRPGRAHASDLHLGISEPVQSIRFHEANGQDIGSLDL